MKKLISLFIMVSSVCFGLNRQELLVGNFSSTTLLTMQVQTTISSNQADFWSKVKNDGGDIRLKDTAGNLLSYWVESFDYTGKTAILWIKVPYLPQNANTIIYLDYGDNSLTSLSNGSAVFEFFDDFTSTLDTSTKWVTNGGSTGVSGASTSVTTSGTGTLDVWAAGADRILLMKKTWAPADKCIIGVREKMPTTGLNVLSCLTDSTSSTSITSTKYGIQDTGGSQNRLQTTVNSSTTYLTLQNYLANAWQKIKIYKKSSIDYSLQQLNDSNLLLQSIDKTDTSWQYTNWTWCCIPNSANHAIYDWVYAAKYEDVSVAFGDYYDVNTYLLSGKIIYGITGLPNAAITLTKTPGGTPQSTVSKLGGQYSFRVLKTDTGSYTVSFSKSGYSFLPVSLNATISGDTVFADTKALILGTSTAEISAGLFTPGSGDSRFNSVQFSVANTGNELLSLSIYSSNGVLVREVPGSGTGVAWDGRNTSGNISKGGIYFYQLKVGSAVVKTGTVSLIR